MKKLIAIGLVVVLALTLGVTPVFAGIGKDIKDQGDNGAHYNLNIIGVQHDKTVPDMTGSNRHTIFVRLGEDGTPEHVTINVVRNYANPDKFQVTDGNATDADGSATIAVPFEDYGTLSYNVYAVALGKFGGKAKVEATVTFAAGTYGELLLGDFELKREKANNNGKGKPKVVNISEIFRATGWIDICGEMGVKDPCDITFTNVWVFNVPTLLTYLWDYGNEGLKLMQVRFYETTSGEWTNVPQD